MRTAYSLLGILFLIVFGAAYVFLERAHAPASEMDVVQETYNNEQSMLTLTSSAFKNGGSIPSHYTCEGENVNPDLSISNIPKGTVSLALLVEDPDIPEAVKVNMGLDIFDHWVVFNIPPETRSIEAGSRPAGTIGMNSAGQGYTGPCPPDREHRYFFKLYALDIMLPLNASAHKADVAVAMRGHILEQATLLGVYEKKN